MSGLDSHLITRKQFTEVCPGKDLAIFLIDSSRQNRFNLFQAGEREAREFTFAGAYALSAANRVCFTNHFGFHYVLPRFRNLANSCDLDARNLIC
jgi:hypothetical protein